MRWEIRHRWDGAPLPWQGTVEVSAEGEDVLVQVEAPFHGDPPPTRPPGHTPRLWEHEVVEWFCVGAGEPVPYLELELGPHGHYLALSLRGVRAPLWSDRELAYQATIDGALWRGEARLPRAWLPDEPVSANAFAIHGRGRARSYAACHPVPGAGPDFHRLAAFGPCADPTGP